MFFQRIHSLLVVPALVLATGTALAQTHTAVFDGNPEGSLGTSYVEDGITFSDLDRYLGGSNETFVAEDASTSLAGFPDFTPPMTLGFGGYSPGGSVGYSRCGSFKITPPIVLDAASLSVYVVGGSSAGNTVTLEARFGGSLVGSDQFVVPSPFGPHHFPLGVTGVNYDELLLVGAGSGNSGSFFAVVDTVVLGRGVVGTGYCFGDGLGTSCPCGNNNYGSEGGCDWGNPAFPGGGVLEATGSRSMAAADTFLEASDVENNFGIFFGANDQVNGGNGNPLNDGLRCAGGALVRLIPPTIASGNQLTLPQPVQVLDSGAAAGVTRRYQYWFRTPNGPCGTSANLTNGYEIVWQL